MSDRMTYKRLAFLLEQPECNWPESEVMQALKVERAKVNELETERETWDGYKVCELLRKDVAELEATIRRLCEAAGFDVEAWLDKQEQRG